MNALVNEISLIQVQGVKRATRRPGNNLVPNLNSRQNLTDSPIKQQYQVDFCEQKGKIGFNSHKPSF